MPLLVAGLAIPSSLALIYIVAQQVEMSVFVLNIATMLGLALAIDYSLFIVSRYREELRRGRTVGEAVERAVATAGKAVAFSGIAVAIGLSGLLLFEAPAIRSIGIAGALVVVCSVVFALTFLPAVLGMLGPRVNALSIRASCATDSDRRPTTSRSPAQSRWERVARAVMRRPIAVLVPTLAILLIAGSPFLRLEQGVPGRRDLSGRRREPRRVRRAPDRVRAGRDDADRHPRRRPGLTDRSRQHPGARRLRSAASTALDGIDRVERPVHRSATRQTVRSLTPEQVAALYALPAGQRPPGLDALLAQYVRGSTVRLDAISPLPPSEPAGDRPHPGDPGDRSGRRHHDPGRRQRRDRA